MSYTVEKNVNLSIKLCGEFSKPFNAALRRQAVSSERLESLNGRRLRPKSQPFRDLRESRRYTVGNVRTYYITGS